MKNDGYTGRNFNRPGFQAMLAEAEAGKIGTIIVKDMSRFCRNYLEVGFYTEILFPKKQIRFVAINNSVDSDKPQDNDFTPFLNIMNEWYAKDTSNKISRARQKRRSNTALFTRAVMFCMILHGWTNTLMGVVDINQDPLYYVLLAVMTAISTIISIWIQKKRENVHS